MDEHTCKRCGHTWTAYVKAPLCCPRCKRYTWRVPPHVVRSCECVLCHHTWQTRRDVDPSRCPACRSDGWDQAEPPGFRFTPYRVWIPDASVERDCCWEHLPTIDYPDRLLKHCQGKIHQRRQREERPGMLVAMWLMSGDWAVTIGLSERPLNYKQYREIEG